MGSGKNSKSVGLPRRRKETISRRQERETISGYQVRHWLGEKLNPHGELERVLF